MEDIYSFTVLYVQCTAWATILTSVGCIFYFPYPQYLPTLSLPPLSFLCSLCQSVNQQNDCDEYVTAAVVVYDSKSPKPGSTQEICPLILLLLQLQVILLRVALTAPQHVTLYYLSESTFVPPLLLHTHTPLHLLTPPYLYGMCLLPLTRARITLPRADRERHRGAELGGEFSLPFPPPPSPPTTLTSQLPRSSRWRRLRPPDTSKAE